MGQVKCSKRSAILIAVASSSVVSAFRAPSSSSSSVSRFQYDNILTPTAAFADHYSSPRRTRIRCRVNASVLSDSCDADEQECLQGDDVSSVDIINFAMESARSNGIKVKVVNGDHSILDFASGNSVNIVYEEEEQRLQQNNNDLPRSNSLTQQQPQQQQEEGGRQQAINKRYNARKNNTAMADPDFLRKRTDTLLRITQGGYKTSTGEYLEMLGSLKVDKRTFDWLIDAWSYSGEDDASDKALSLLSRMEELRDNYYTDVDGGDEQPAVVSPDVKSYTKVINAIAHSGKSDAGERAEEVLKRMTTMSSSSSLQMNNDLRPNTLTYTYVIDAYSRSSSPRAPHAAQRIVEEMERLRAEGDPEVRPTSRAWNSVISAWAQWEGEEMAWGRIGNGAERAEACLHIMEEWADSTGNEDTRPNSYNYNSVISALANSHEAGAASRAEKILERMEDLYRMTGDDSVKPRTATYNAIIDAWAKSGEVDAAEHAELLLAHMMELYVTGHNLDAKPNVRSFNSVLNALAKSAGHPMAPERACEVLTQMEELGRSSSHLKVSPDATSFATVINAFARSHTYGKADRAFDIFKHMKELYDASGKSTLRPNSVVYNSVLNACAFAVGDLEEQSRSMEIANAMLVELNDCPYGKPDHITYGTYLKVINNQMPPSGARNQIVETVFRKCVKDGMVGEMVLRQLREMGMEAIYETLAGKSMMWGEINLSELPKEWIRNVIEGKKQRRQFRR